MIRAGFIGCKKPGPLTQGFLNTCSSALVFWSNMIRVRSIQWILLILIILKEDCYNGGAVVISERSLNPSGLLGPISVENGTVCNTEFSRELIISHPISLNEDDRQYRISNLQLQAYEMVLDYVNEKRCGVWLDENTNYLLKIRSFGDESDTESVAAIADYITQGNATDANSFFLGPYSSTLTLPMANTTQNNGKLLIAAGAATSSIYEGRDLIFGTFPKAGVYLAQAVEALSTVGAKTVASIYEDASFTKSVCGSISSLAERFNMSVTSETMVVRGPNQTDLLPIVDNLVVENPDVVITCVYTPGCIEWIHSMKEKDWSPKAQVFTVCVGSTEFEKGVGVDSEYIIGVSPWHESLKIEDTITGWSAKTFADKFKAYTSQIATYQASSAAGAMSILIQALESEQTLDIDTIKESFLKNIYTTQYGNVSFDESGQSEAPCLVLQYTDDENNVDTVYPERLQSSKISYPMPSWGFRKCKRTGGCEKSGGTCEEDGECVCPVGLMIVKQVENPYCIISPKENFNFIRTGFKYLGYVAVTLQGLVSCFAIAWTYIYRRNELVRVSQPNFLRAIAVGCFIMTTAIIPASIETEYRFQIDPTTLAFTDEPNPAVRGVDIACMAVFWLHNMGFIMMFSALFAKLWRIKRLFDGSVLRRRISERDVLKVMLMLCSLMLVIMIIFQIVAPLKWDRSITRFDSSNFRAESSGRCQINKMSGAFLIIATVFHACCLVCAVVLSYQIRKIPVEFNEGKYVTGAIFCLCQVFMIAIPILFIVSSNTTAFFFVEVIIAFVEAFVVMMLIFVPKLFASLSNDNVSAKIKVREAIGRFSREATNSSFKNACSATSSSFQKTSGTVNSDIFEGRRNSKGRNVSFTENKNSQVSQVSQVSQASQASQGSIMN